MRLFVILIVCLCVCSCDFFEYENNKYATYEELERNSEPGNWVPKLLPKSASNIKENHYVDNPESWGSFEVSNESDFMFRKFCSSYGGKEIENIIARKKPEWLTSTGSRKFYLCDGNTLLTADRMNKVTVLYFFYRPEGFE